MKPIDHGQQVPVPAFHLAKPEVDVSSSVKPDALFMGSSLFNRARDFPASGPLNCGRIRSKYLVRMLRNLPSVEAGRNAAPETLQNNDRKPSDVVKRMIEAMAPLALPARQSITFDRGIEFRSWRELDKGMGTQAWFCDPQTPWQKGTVENTSKRARRHLPRSIAPLSLPPRSIREIFDRLNATPEKVPWISNTNGGISKTGSRLRLS